jgi:hypothetical protein
MKSKNKKLFEKVEKDSRSPPNVAGPSHSPVERKKKQGQTMLPFTMKDHLEMYTSA